MAAAIEEEIGAVFDQEWPKEGAITPGKALPLTATMERPSDWVEAAGFAPT